MKYKVELIDLVCLVLYTALVGRWAFIPFFGYVLLAMFLERRFIKRKGKKNE